MISQRGVYYIHPYAIGKFKCSRPVILLDQMFRKIVFISQTETTS